MHCKAMHCRSSAIAWQSEGYKTVEPSERFLYNEDESPPAHGHDPRGRRNAERPRP